ncbi:MAG: Ig domain-containing protein [Candidatus Acidiferrales bacterium]
MKKIDIGFVALSIVLSFPAAALAQNSTPPQAPAKAPAAKIPAIPPPPGIPPAGQKPTIAPQDKVTFTVGKLSSFMVKATGVPAPTLTQTGLPTDLGLSFDSKTGILQGSATKAIIAIITIQAKNKSGAVSKSFTLTVTDPPPCDGDTYTVRLRALQGADADGLAAALNGTFDEFSAVSATAPASSAGSNGSQNPSAAGASGQGQSQQNSSPPKQFLCVYKRETDAKTGKLTALVPVLPLPAVQSNLQDVIRKLDRPEFAGVALDERFLVHFVNITSLLYLVNALPAPAPGLELSPDDVTGKYLIIHPAGTDLQLATKAGSDLASQAAKVKHDLLALDAQYGLMAADNADANGLVQATSNAVSLANFFAGTDELDRLERWDAIHTVLLAALEPRDVSTQLASLFPNRYIQVLAAQRAITIRPITLKPSSLPPGTQQGILVASDAITRNAIYERYKAEQAWEQTLQADAATNAKQGSSNSTSPQSPTTTTTSNTTITTPAPSAPPAAAGAAAAKAPAPIQIQTSTSTQTTTPASGQGGSNSATPAQNAANPSSSGTPAGAGATPSGGSSSPSGAMGAPGSTGGTPASSTQTQTPQPKPVAGEVVRLFHLREASNMSTVINAIGPGAGNSPLVQSLSDFGNDDLLLILPPAQGQPDRTESIRRMISSLDEPRPDISLQVWSYEISSEKARKASDSSHSVEEAEQVSDAYSKFIRAVESADNLIQVAMAAGMASAVTDSRQSDFFDQDFKNYLTRTSPECFKEDYYCLGYDTALDFGSTSAPIGRAKVSLDRFVILVAAAGDKQAGTMVKNAIQAMQNSPCAPEPPLPLSCGPAPQTADDCSPKPTSLLFRNFLGALQLLAQPPNLHLFRAAVLDFLFQYKWSQAYPNDFDPYYLQRSAQNLDGYLNYLITALNRDLDLYLHDRLTQEAHCLTGNAHKVGLANYGEVQVSAISGNLANVSGAVNNYFDITQPALLKDVLSGLLGGAGGSGQGSSSGGASTPSTGTTTTTTTTTSAPTPPPASGGTSSGAGALASAAKLLTPWQAVALNALATASAPPQLVAQVNAQTTLAVTPVSLDTASAAELNLSLQISNPTTTIDASKSSTSSFIRQNMANSVANYNTQTRVRVDSLKLFQVSSLSMDLTHPQSTVPVPVVGWAYEAVFGTVPWMKDHILAIPREPLTVQNRSVAVVRAVVVPTAFDLGLSMPFRSDHIEDPISQTSKSLSSVAQTNNKLAEFHKKFIACILKGEDPDCRSTTHLSDIKEITN